MRPLQQDRPVQSLTYAAKTLLAEFWLKTDTYLEQPDVTYTKELLLLAEGFKGGESFSASFSSLGGINQLNHAGLRAAVVKVGEAMQLSEEVGKMFRVLRAATGICGAACRMLGGSGRVAASYRYRPEELPTLAPSTLIGQSWGRRASKSL